MFSCQEYREELTEMVGLYSASLVGNNEVFDAVISIESGDDIRIEALFDGEYWDTVLADVDCIDCEIKDIDIYEQYLGEDVFIYGKGYYSYGTIQLDYTMSIFGEEYEYSLVGTK